jgi:hypothetical protein
MSGWSSNSKYAFLGALRSTAQMVSYEVSIGFILAILLLSCGTLNLSEMIEAQQNAWFIIPYFPLALLFFISALAETNRHPFDLPEAEAELVSGYNVEYSAVGFALFSLGEYANMLLMSSCTVIFFLGGWLSPFVGLDVFNLISITEFFGAFWFSVKIIFMVILYVWIRAPKNSVIEIKLNTSNPTKGESQPPKKKITVHELIKSIFAYSPNENKAKPTAEYSTLYPETNSASASGKSKGCRFVSANAEIKNNNAKGK